MSTYSYIYAYGLPNFEINIPIVRIHKISTFYVRSSLDVFIKA